MYVTSRNSDRQSRRCTVPGVVSDSVDVFDPPFTMVYIDSTRRSHHVAADDRNVGNSRLAPHAGLRGDFSNSPLSLVFSRPTSARMAPINAFESGQGQVSRALLHPVQQMASVKHRQPVGPELSASHRPSGSAALTGCSYVGPLGHEQPTVCIFS